MPGVPSTVRRVLVDKGHLMTTSGVYRSWVDVDIECRCGFEGSTLACEDAEDFSFSWSCPGCGWETTEELQ